MDTVGPLCSGCFGLGTRPSTGMSSTLKAGVDWTGEDLEEVMGDGKERVPGREAEEGESAWRRGRPGVAKGDGGGGADGRRSGVVTGVKGGMNLEGRNDIHRRRVDGGGGEGAHGGAVGRARGYRSGGTREGAGEVRAMMNEAVGTTASAAWFTCCGVR